MAQKERLFAPQPQLRLIGDLMKFCAHEMRDYKPLSVSGYHIRKMAGLGRARFRPMLAAAVALDRDLVRGEP